MYERVLVGLDRSDHARPALDATRELAKLADAEVRVLHVREGQIAYGRGAPLEDDSEDAAEALVDAAVKELTDAGLRATGTVRAALSGAVAGDIIDEGKEWGATVIVLASRGLTELKGILVGSTTHNVIRLSEIPVIVVR
jgi:nucleotide-binding universal stress UspA family protein